MAEMIVPYERTLAYQSELAHAVTNGRNKDTVITSAWCQLKSLGNVLDCVVLELISAGAVFPTIRKEAAEMLAARKEKALLAIAA